MERTLISQTKNYLERQVEGLREYEPPPPCKVFDLQGNLKRIEIPTEAPKFSFNGGKKKK